MFIKGVLEACELMANGKEFLDSLSISYKSLEIWSTAGCFYASLNLNTQKTLSYDSPCDINSWKYDDNIKIKKLKTNNFIGFYGLETRYWDLKLQTFQICLAPTTWNIFRVPQQHIYFFLLLTIYLWFNGKMHFWFVDFFLTFWKFHLLLHSFCCSRFDSQ